MIHLIFRNEFERGTHHEMARMVQREIDKMILRDLMKAFKAKDAPFFNPDSR